VVSIVCTDSFLYTGANNSLDTVLRMSPRRFGDSLEVLSVLAHVFEAKMQKTQQPIIVGVAPAEINLVYQQLGQSHVFTAPNIGGFYYSSTSLEKTFSEAAAALSLHVSRLYKVEASYKLGLSLADFKRKVSAEDSDDDSDVPDLLVKNTVIAKISLNKSSAALS
jgi:hypothetical protein